LVVTTRGAGSLPACFVTLAMSLSDSPYACASPKM
jgi:hypothetical protein